MKKSLLTALSAVFLLLMSNSIFAQAPKLGAAGSFILFSSSGAVSNTGLSQITGNVGSNSELSTAFGNVNGVMHDMDTVSAKAATDLLVAYHQLDTTTSTAAHAVLLGGGDTLLAGVYALPAASSLSGILNLDAKGDANAVFIFQITGAFSTSALSKINLLNGALACNVFWKVEGAITVASGNVLRGTFIANNAAISLAAGDTLEGRAFSTNGAVGVDGVLAYIPTGCGSTVLSGPVAPVLASAECFALFTADGALSNSGVTTVSGDVGTNVGATTGFNALKVKGMIHAGPDTTTAKAAADLLVAYAYLDTLPYDIELLYPAQLGKGLVLTPHTYIMQAAATLTDTLTLNAMGKADAVFVIKINGALSTGTHANVSLINGAQSKNVYWLVNGAVNFGDSTIFRGTLISNNGAVGVFPTGVLLDGRALLTAGALTTAAITATAPTLCKQLSVASQSVTSKPVTIYPNPFTNSLFVTINQASQANICEVRIYNVLGKEVLNSKITQQFTTLETGKLTSGIYFYKVIAGNKTIQSGKLISQ